MNLYETWFESMIVIIAAVGLVTHSGIFKSKFRVNMFLYYTNLSNLLVLVYFLCRVVIKYRGVQSGDFYTIFYSGFLHLSITASILITFLIYHFLIAPVVKKSNLESAEFKLNSFDNIAVHYITPVLTFIDWLLLADKSSLSWMSGVLWMVIPLGYAIFALVRGMLGGNIKYTTSPYPYPFMDPIEKGWKRVGLNLLIITLGFIVLGMILVGIAKL